MQLNVGYMLTLVAVYLLMGLLVVATLRIMRDYHTDRALNWLGNLTDSKGLVGMERLLRGSALLLALIAMGAMAFWQTESLFVLALFILVSCSGNRARRIASNLES